MEEPQNSALMVRVRFTLPLSDDTAGNTLHIPTRERDVLVPPMSRSTQHLERETEVHWLADHQGCAGSEPRSGGCRGGRTAAGGGADETPGHCGGGPRPPTSGRGQPVVARLTLSRPCQWCSRCPRCTHAGRTGQVESPAQNLHHCLETCASLLLHHPHAPHRRWRHFGS